MSHKEHKRVDKCCGKDKVCTKEIRIIQTDGEVGPTGASGANATVPGYLTALLTEDFVVPPLGDTLVPFQFYLSENFIGNTGIDTFTAESSGLYTINYTVQFAYSGLIGPTGDQPLAFSAGLLLNGVDVIDGTLLLEVRSPLFATDALTTSFSASTLFPFFEGEFVSLRLLNTSSNPVTVNQVTLNLVGVPFVSVFAQQSNQQQISSHSSLRRNVKPSSTMTDKLMKKTLALRKD